jgi:hypothetical protein
MSLAPYGAAAYLAMYFSTLSWRHVDAQRQRPGPVSPRRVQLSRKPGWRKPPGAVVVSRPTRWGNPFPVATFGRDQAVAMFRRYLADHPELVEAARRELAGKDLACWCKPGELCHADIWLEVANGSAAHDRQAEPQGGGRTGE